jgi:hypothetical protein
MFDQEGTPVKLPDEPGPAAVDPAAVDPVELSDDELDKQTQALWARVHVAMGRAVALQAEINRRGLWGTWGARSPGHWLSWRTGLSTPEANRLCAVADRIDDCPGTKKALTAGELSLAKAAAITRVATDATEDTLLHYARHAPTPELEAIARAYRKVTESRDETDRHRRRYLTTFFDEHRDYIIKGRLTPDAGAVVEKALGAAHDKIPRDPEADTSARYADALVAVADTALGAMDNSSGADRYQVVVHVSDDVLRPGLCEVEPGAEIAPETARRIACDAALVEMIERDGMPPVPGRKSRIVPTRLRRALTARDRSCRWPGCTSRGHYDAHHIVFWGDGGPTVLDNLVLLCRFHHRAVHEDGFSIVASGSEFKFFSPGGWEIPAVPQSPPPNGDIGTAVSALGVDVDPERILPAQLVGEADIDLCVHCLLEDDARAARDAAPSEARASP